MRNKPFEDEPKPRTHCLFRFIRTCNRPRLGSDGERTPAASSSRTDASRRIVHMIVWDWIRRWRVKVPIEPKSFPGRLLPRQFLAVAENEEEEEEERKKERIALLLQLTAFGSQVTA